MKVHIWCENKSLATMKEVEAKFENTVFTPDGERGVLWNHLAFLTDFDSVVAALSLSEKTAAEIKPILLKKNGGERKLADTWFKHNGMTVTIQTGHTPEFFKNNPFTVICDSSFTMPR